MITFILEKVWLTSRFVFWSSLWILGLIMLVLYPVRWLSGDYLAPVRIINYILPWTLILLIPAMVVAGLARRKWLGVILSGPILVIGVTYGPLFLPHARPPLPANKFKLKIMSHNVFFRQDVVPILKVIQQEQPDILLIQELHPDIASRSLAELIDFYPEMYVDVVNQPERHFVQAILSRYPITRLRAEFDKGRAQKVRVDTPDGPIEIWNIHLLPPFRVPPEWHDQQARALVADINAADGPLIVAGDFNAADQSATYKAVNNYLNNARWKVGWGFGFTYPAPPHIIRELAFDTGLLYRLDHIFYSDHFIAHEARTLATPAGSDHLPITAEVTIQPPSQIEPK